MLAKHLEELGSFLSTQTVKKSWKLINYDHKNIFIPLNLYTVLTITASSYTSHNTTQNHLK